RDAPGRLEEAGRLECPPRGVTHRSVGERVAEKMRGAGEARLGGKPSVLEGAEGRKDVGLLVAPADADPRPPVGGKMGDVPALVADRAGGGSQLARKQVEQRRLARSVGPEQRMQAAAVELNGDARGGGQAAEAARQALRGEDRLSQRRSPRRACA